MGIEVDQDKPRGLLILLMGIYLTDLMEDALKVFVEHILGTNL
jgi:hypothetical protein